MRERETGQPPPEWNTFCSHQTCADSPLSRHFLFTQAHIRGATITVCPPPEYIYTHCFFYRYENQNCGLSSLNVSLLLPSGHVLLRLYKRAVVTSKTESFDASNQTEQSAEKYLEKQIFVAATFCSSSDFIWRRKRLRRRVCDVGLSQNIWRWISLPHCFLILLFASNKVQSSFFFFPTSWLPSTEIVISVPVKPDAKWQFSHVRLPVSQSGFGPHCYGTFRCKRLMCSMFLVLN